MRDLKKNLPTIHMLEKISCSAVLFHRGYNYFLYVKMHINIYIRVLAFLGAFGKILLKQF